MINRCHLNTTIARRTLWEVREGDQVKSGWTSVGCAATCLPAFAWREDVRARRWARRRGRQHLQVKGGVAEMRPEAEKGLGWPADFRCREPGRKQTAPRSPGGTSPVTPSSQTSSFPSREAVPFWCGEWSGQPWETTARTG